MPGGWRFDNPVTQLAIFAQIVAAIFFLHGKFHLNASQGEFVFLAVVIEFYGFGFAVCG